MEELRKLEKEFREKLSLVSDEDQFNSLLEKLRILTDERDILFKEKTQKLEENASLQYKIDFLEKEKEQQTANLSALLGQNQKMAKGMRTVLEQLNSLKKESYGYQRLFEAGWNNIIKTVENFQAIVIKKTNARLASLRENHQKQIEELKKNYEKQMTRMEGSQKTVAEQLRKQILSEREDSDTVQEGLTQTIDALKREIYQLSMEKGKTNNTGQSHDLPKVPEKLSVNDKAGTSWGLEERSDPSRSSQNFERNDVLFSGSKNEGLSLNLKSDTRAVKSWEEPNDFLEEELGPEKKAEESKSLSKSEIPEGNYAPKPRSTVGLMGPKITSNVSLEDELDLDSIKLPEKKSTGLIVKKTLNAKKKT